MILQGLPSKGVDGREEGLTQRHSVPLPDSVSSPRRMSGDGVKRDSLDSVIAPRGNLLSQEILNIRRTESAPVKLLVPASTSVQLPHDRLKEDSELCKPMDQESVYENEEDRGGEREREEGDEDEEEDDYETHEDQITVPGRRGGGDQSWNSASLPMLFPLKLSVEECAVELSASLQPVRYLQFLHVHVLLQCTYYDHYSIYRFAPDASMFYPPLLSYEGPVGQANLVMSPGFWEVYVSVSPTHHFLSFFFL